MERRDRDGPVRIGREGRDGPVRLGREGRDGGPVQVERSVNVRDGVVVEDRRIDRGIDRPVERRVEDSVRDWRARERAVAGGDRPSEIQERNERRAPVARIGREREGERLVERRDRDIRTVPVVSRVPREGTQPPQREARRSDRSGHRWRGDWRHDRRYDWRRWRDSNRSRFRLGIYYDPFGWRYRPFQIGWRMWPDYYRSNYWLNDPWSYRLPYAPPGYRWIRYYGDAVLVDMWNGEVIDVIHNFFW